MKKLYPLLAVVLLAITTYAQPSLTPDVTDSNKSSDTKTVIPKTTKVEVPREKAKPQNVPKIALAMTIDGRPDEEAWKNGNCFQGLLSNKPRRQHRSLKTAGSIDDV